MIMVVDGTGAAVREVAKFRPDMPVLAVVSDEKVGRQLMLHRGVYPIVLSGGVDEGLAAAKAAGMIEAGGTAVVLDCGSGDAPLTTIITG